jgi:glucokinase
VQFPFPVLLADIGGTHTRLAVAAEPQMPLDSLVPQRTSDHADLPAAVRQALGSTGIRPRSILVAAAGPAQGRRIKLTNATWTIDGPVAIRELGFEQGLMLNDFEAQALSIPVLRNEWLRPIGPVNEEAKGPRLIHGPGTGLGTAALIETCGRWHSIASEAGHLDFAPVTETERRFWPHIQPALGRVTPETLISGPGMRRLHDALLASRGRARAGLESAAIIKKALADRSSEEARSVRVFWRLAARFAGDMALTFLATGGVILAGGMLPRVVDLLDEADFRQAFENKAPYVDLMKRMPVRLLVGRDTVLSGLAAVAADPDRYDIDYAARAWR